MCLILPQINTVSYPTTPPPSKTSQTNESRSHNEGAVASLNLVILVHNEFMDENQRFVVRRVEDLNALSDVTGCFLMYVRCLLNEYTTGRDSRKSQTNKHNPVLYLESCQNRG